MTRVLWMTKDIRTNIASAFSSRIYYSGSWERSFVCSAQAEYDSYVFVYRSEWFR